MTDDSPVVYCVDVGSIPNGKLGWARVRQDEEQLSSNIEVLAARIADDLSAHRVALGFECPLFVPLHTKSSEVLCCRPGEKNRPWSASAGIASLGAGLVESGWLLTRVLSMCATKIPVFIHPDEFLSVTRGLLLWEAFVTGKRTSTHEQDALAAARKFQSSWPALQDEIPCKGVEVLSLIAMVAIRTGWTQDLNLLKQKPVVINPCADI